MSYDIHPRYEEVIGNADRFLKLLHDFCSLGAAMRSVMTKCLVDKEVRQSFFKSKGGKPTKFFLRRRLDTLFKKLKSGKPTNNFFKKEVRHSI
jgi:hypothetical protein